LEIYPSHQYEFARLNVTYTVMSKRKLLALVNEKYVNGWDDPRMPTLSGMRRRGYTPESIREFCDKIGVAKRENLIDIGLLEFCVREHLNKIALRRMVVLNPIKVVLTNYPEGQEEILTSENNPEDPSLGLREMPFGKELLIEADDFMEVPAKKYFRLAPGQMVRLKSAFIIKCDTFVKDANGSITELHCTYVPESRSGSDTSGLSVKGVIHWLSARHAVPIEVRQYDRLFRVEDPALIGDNLRDALHPDSIKVTTAMAEPALQSATKADRFQFMRTGYFCLDTDATEKKLIFNRTVTLKDMWAKETAKGK
jgi:glutaminyl-tRNA synthetase